MTTSNQLLHIYHLLQFIALTSVSIDYSIGGLVAMGICAILAGIFMVITKVCLRDDVHKFYELWIISLHLLCQACALANLWKPDANLPLIYLAMYGNLGVLLCSRKQLYGHSALIWICAVSALASSATYSVLPTVFTLTVFCTMMILYAVVEMWHIVKDEVLEQNVKMIIIAFLYIHFVMFFMISITLPVTSDVIMELVAVLCAVDVLTILRMMAVSINPEIIDLFQWALVCTTAAVCFPLGRERWSYGQVFMVLLVIRGVCTMVILCQSEPLLLRQNMQSWKNTREIFSIAIHTWILCIIGLCFFDLALKFNVLILVTIVLSNMLSGFINMRALPIFDPCIFAFFALLAFTYAIFIPFMKNVIVPEAFSFVCLVPAFGIFHIDRCLASRGTPIPSVEV